MVTNASASQNGVLVQLLALASDVSGVLASSALNISIVEPLLVLSVLPSAVDAANSPNDVVYTVRVTNTLATPSLLDAFNVSFARTFSSSDNVSFLVISSTGAANATQLVVSFMSATYHRWVR